MQRPPSFRRGHSVQGLMRAKSLISGQYSTRGNGEGQCQREGAAGLAIPGAPTTTPAASPGDSGCPATDASPGHPCYTPRPRRPQPPRQIHSPSSPPSFPRPSREPPNPAISPGAPSPAPAASPRVPGHPPTPPSRESTHLSPQIPPSSRLPGRPQHQPPETPP